MIYLDNNATTRIDPEVVEAMQPFNTGLYGNPSSFHSFGDKIYESIEDAREKVAALLGCSPAEIIFTSGGTESDNTVLFGVPEMNPSRPGIVVTSVEHPAVLDTARYLSKHGHPLEIAGVDRNGVLLLDELKSSINKYTGIVSVMMANNETGVIQPVEEAVRIAHEGGALFHTDAVQAVAKIPFNVSELDIDFLSLSSHKLHGPKGVGALYIRKGMNLPPLIHGGHQEKGYRAGTYNVAGIVGLGKAAELAMGFLDAEVKNTHALLTKLETGILSSCPGSKVLGADVKRLPNTATIIFEGCESEAILTLLDIQEIYVSSGSACSTGSTSPSYVLSAMGIDDFRANTAIRFSLSRNTTDSEIDKVLIELPKIIGKLRQISPYT